MVTRTSSTRRTPAFSAKQSSVQPSPTISSIVVTDSNYVDLDDTAIGTSGGYIKLKGFGFTQNSFVLFNGSNVTNTYVSSTEYRAVIPATAAGSYNVMVFNNNVGCIYVGASVSGFPSFTQSTYLNYTLTVNVQLLATGDGTLTYSLYSGSLPSGLTLSSNGLISGTTTGDSTSSFDVLVNDSQNQTTQQTITLTISSSDTYWKNTVLVLTGDPTTSNPVTVYDDASVLSSVVTVNGDTRPSNKSPFSSPTFSDGSAYFDGTGDYLSIADTASLRIGTSDFTIEGWFYATSVSGQRGIVAKGPDAATTGWEIRINGAVGGQLAMTYTSTVLTGTTVIATNTWYHFALVRSGTASGNIKLYLNGVLEGTSATARNDDFSQTDNMYIGYTRQVSSPQPFLGYISNIRVTKQALYTGNFTPSTVSLTTTSQSANSSNVLYLGCQTNISNENSKIIDISNNDITIVRNNNVSQGAFTPTGNNWSVYFDGVGDNLTAPANASFNIASSADYTIEGWVCYSNSAPTSQGFFQTDTNLGASSGTFWFGYSGGGLIVSKHASTAQIRSTWNPNVGQWYHIAASRNAGTLRLFVDGVVANTVSDTTSYVSSGAAIGVYTTPAYLNGYISNLRFSKQGLYTANFTPSITPLTTTSQGVSAANVVLLTCQTYQFKDNSLNNFTLTANADVAISRFSPFPGSNTYNSSANGGSLIFNTATSDYLSIASNSLINLGAGDFTFETWIYYNSSTVTGTLFDWRGGTNGISVVAPAIAPSASGYNWYTRAVNQILSGSNTIKLRQWQHLAVSRVSGNTRMFLDGVQVGSTYVDGNNYPASGLNICRQNDGTATTAYFPGYLYNFRVVVGTGLYSSTFTPSTAPYTATSSANTRLLLATTPGGVVDRSMMNHLVTIGSSKISPVTEKFGTHSVFFDGAGDYLIARNNANQFGFGTGDFTIEGWLYTTTVAAGNRTICATRTSSSDTTSGYFSLMLSGSALNFYSGSANVVAAGTVTVNTWTHFAVTRNTGNVRLFLSGTQVGSTTSYTTNMPSGLTLTIGDNAGASESWNGYLDDLRVTKGYARYVANFTVSSTTFALV